MILILISGCGVGIEKKITAYQSRCQLYHMKELVLFLKEDSVFYYKRPFVYQEIKGRWHIAKDSLILTSDLFKSEHLSKVDSTYPVVKYTNLENKDIFIIKKRILYPINKQGVDSICYLVRIRN